MNFSLVAKEEFQVEGNQGKGGGGNELRPHFLWKKFEENVGKFS